jgi:hypothetical protein
MAAEYATMPLEALERLSFLEQEGKILYGHSCTR